MAHFVRWFTIKHGDFRKKNANGMNAGRKKMADFGMNVSDLDGWTVGFLGFLCIKLCILVSGLEHEFYDFPYIGNNNPNWLSYFSEGLKSPTSVCVMLNTLKSADKSEILLACQGTGNVREGTGAWCSTEWSAGYVVHVMLLVCLICLHVYMYVDFQNILAFPKWYSNDV